MTLQAWTGEEWQARCMRLLSVRYGLDLQRVPSGRLRDGGIEGFARDGTLFQCYAVLEPRTTDTRYTAQRDKLTEDLGKLQTNREVLQELLGDVLIETYAFMVPVFDGFRLPTHATSKTAEVRSWNLQFIAENFSISVVTEEDFPAEVATLIRQGADIANVELPVIDAGAADRYAAANSKLIGNLNRKVSHLPASEPARAAAIREQFLHHYLIGEELLSDLRESRPEVLRDVDAVTAVRTTLLPSESLLSTDDPQQRLQAVIGRHREQLEAIPGISPLEAELLALGAVADWLMRCPLDFQVAGG